MRWKPCWKAPFCKQAPEAQFPSLAFPHSVHRLRAVKGLSNSICHQVALGQELPLAMPSDFAFERSVFPEFEKFVASRPRDSLAPVTQVDG